MRGKLVLLAIEEFEGPIYIYFKSVITGTRINSYSKVRREAGGALTRRPLRSRVPLEAENHPMMVMGSLGPSGSGRPWRVTASSANDTGHMAASLGNLLIPDSAMELSARSETSGGLGCCAACSSNQQRL